MRIVIFGVGTGLSRSVANLFGEKGFSVLLVARNEEKLQNETKLLQDKGISVAYRVADVSDGQEMFSVLTEIKRPETLPDVILFNAFANMSGGFADETWDNLKKELDVNVGGAFHILKEMLPMYQEVGKGSLFFTGGGFGITPVPDYLGISIGKAALRNMVQAAATQMNGTGVHVATVTVMGFIGGEDPKYAPDRIAEEYWKLYNQEAGNFETEIIY